MQYSPPAAATVNLRRLCIIRAVVVGLQAAATLVAWHFLHWPLPYTALTGIFVLLMGITIAAWWRSYRAWPVTDAEYSAHLVVDVIGLTAVMYLAGGAGNPFVSYFLVPLSIAAATLPRRHAALIAGLCLAAYSWLLVFYRPLPLLAPHSGGDAAQLHTIGMWMNFVVSAALITFFVARMAGGLRAREQALNRHREERMRNEQLLAVATLAAGTAHELATPLGTMRLLLDEMVDEADAPVREDLETLRSQLGICTHSLERLVETARSLSEGSETRISAPHFFRRLREHWQLLRPGVPLAAQIDESVMATLSLPADPTLTQAVLNLLDNAADVSPDDIALQATVEKDELVIRVLDRGPGMPTTTAEPPGTPFLTTKGGGLGLGLFLSHATASRYGGSLTWYPRRGGGSLLELRLPVAQLKSRRAEASRAAPATTDARP